MCGICGIFAPDLRPVAADRILAMRDRMINRGPDGAGILAGRGFGLGHRRLSIIDLSAAGSQPMSNEDGTVHVVFNGEIYNFLELRMELEGKGHHFTSKTDTEVLIHGYEEWGGRVLLEKIRGMFAFGIVDERNHSILLARDPLGKKPLFFYNKNGELLFASTIGSLLAGLNETPEIMPGAVNELLWNLYIPGPGTIFRGVEKVKPGHYLYLDADNHPIQTAHWQPDFMHPDEGPDFNEWLEEIESKLKTAVMKRLVADVPIGVLLSGGVDSSLIAAFASEGRDNIRTFSVQTEDPNWDESRYAKIVSSHLGTNHRTLLVDGNMVTSGLPFLVQGMGEPLADPSLLNVFSIARLAREEVSVVLTGDGGDEAFGGYQGYFAYYMADRLRPFVNHLPRGILKRVAESFRKATGLPRRIGTLLWLTIQPQEATFGVEGWLNSSIRRTLYSHEMQNTLVDSNPFRHLTEALSKIRCPRGVDRIMQVQMGTLLVDDYLSKVDFGNMSVSLEARSPLLDVDLVDRATKIPARLRFKGFKKKAVLKALARKMVPPSCVDRPKMGFRAPVGRWLSGPWREMVTDHLLGGTLDKHGWFRRETVEYLLSGKDDSVGTSYLVWGIFILELWLRHHAPQASHVQLPRTVDPASTL